MKTKKYIEEKDYTELTNLSKTYGRIAKRTGDKFLGLRITFRGARYAICNILGILDYDSSNYLTIEDLIKLGDLYALNYRQSTAVYDLVYWRGAYDEILKLIEKYFDIKLRSEI